MENNLTIPGWEDDEYRAFKEKFKAKKTTDDCYTPAPVYEAVADWVAREYAADKSRFVRPFFPGGDYEHFAYPEGCAVVDNPPFSILSRILTFYHGHGIPFFLFAPALTLFSSASATLATCIPVGVTVTYENGAQVPTSFVTNMDDPEIRVRTAPSLFSAVKEANDRNLAASKKSLPRYEYPDQILTAAMAQRWCKYGVEYRLRAADCLPISALDAQRSRGLSIFGCGFILGSSAAAERAAAERAATERAATERWTLSDRELEIVKYIDARKTAGGGNGEQRTEQGTDLREAAAGAGDLGGGV